MHNAPSVTYPVGRSRKARSIEVALLAAGALAVALFCLQVQGALWQKAALALSWGTAMAAVVLARRLPAVAQAQWEAPAWTLTGTRGEAILGAAQARVHLDLQGLVLAQLSDDSGASRWLWFERAADPARWLAVRRALHAQSSDGAGTAPAAEAGA